MNKAMIVAALGFAALLLGAQGARAQAVQHCVPFGPDGNAHIDDSLFHGKASTSSPDLVSFCLSLVGPGLGQTGPTVFTINTVPDDVEGACQASGADATRLDVTCDDTAVTKLKGRVK